VADDATPVNRLPMVLLCVAAGLSFIKIRRRTFAPSVSSRSSAFSDPSAALPTSLRLLIFSPLMFLHVRLHCPAARRRLSAGLFLLVRVRPFAPSRSVASSPVRRIAALVSTFAIIFVSAFCRHHETHAMEIPLLQLGWEDGGYSDNRTREAMTPTDEMPDGSNRWPQR
jgi:hypothetical protein